MNSEKILINDSCVLFDLVDLDLLNVFFKLPYRFYTTEQVIDEINDYHQMQMISRFVADRSLIVDQLGDLDIINSIFDEHGSLSFTDCSVLELAIRIDGIMISADKSLRNISKRKNIEVKGLLWIIKLLVDESIITKETAIKKLELYPDVNLRAPIREIDKLLEKLKLE